MLDLIDLIRKKRAKLSESSLKIYQANIKKLLKDLTDEKELSNLDFLKDETKIIDYLDLKAKSTKKNYLNSIVVSLAAVDEELYKDTIEKYNSMIKNLQEQIIDNYESNSKSEKQEANWVNYDKILFLLRKLKRLTTPLLKKDIADLTKKEKDLIQQYLVVYLYSGKAFPPVRNDFDGMRVINDGDEIKPDQNYLVVRKNGHPYFLLNQYKTKKYNGEQTIIIKDLELKKLIIKWLKITGSDYLLINIYDNTPMTANGISKYLNKIFQKFLGKTISSSMLRSIYISKQYENGNLTQKQKKELAEDMGHSKNTAELVYNKID